MMTTLQGTDANSVLRAIESDDNALLGRVGTGDERAIAMLYDRHSKLVYSVAMRVCNDSACAEQVTQNLFMELWLGPNQFRQQSGLLSGKLAFRARNLAVEVLRGRKGAEGSLVSLDAITPANPRNAEPINHTELGLLHKPHALALLLPDVDRQVLEMAFFDAKTTVEIAEKTGLPQEVVTKKVRAALGGLKSGAVLSTDDTGLEVPDLDTSAEFASRRLHTRNIAM